MDIVKPIAKYIIDPIVAARENSSHLVYLRQLEKSQFLSAGEIRDLQVEQLRKLLAHAAKNSPFYGRRFAEAGFNPSQVTNVSDLSRLPVLTKKDIQDNLEELIATNFPRDELIVEHTGGSTGSPLEFYMDRERLFSRKAGAIRHDRWAGLDIGDKVAVLWGNPRDFSDDVSLKKRIKNRLYDRRIFLDTTEISPKQMAEFVERLNDFRPTSYLAYANSMYLYARYIKETALADYHRPRSIITSAEVLLDDQKQVIEEVFDCPVFNRYGSREMSIIASECAQHEGMHICAETILVEMLRGDRPCADNEPGRIVITDLLNYGMPFIRYQIEDVGAPVDAACSCGRGLPMMKISGGRTTDHLVTPEGRVVSGIALALPFVAAIAGAAQLQLVQEKRDLIIVKLVKSPAFTEKTLVQIEEKVLEFFGPKMRHEVEFLDSIPKTASGKYRLSICKMDPMEFLS